MVLRVIIEILLVLVRTQVTIHVMFRIESENEETVATGGGGDNSRVGPRKE
jgi:hypothetical protein